MVSGFRGKAEIRWIVSNWSAATGGCGRSWTAVWHSGWNMAWTRYMAAYTLVWIGREKNILLIKAYGCRDAVPGLLHICAAFTG
jgi:hypothetical protein